ncbi:hypothetical protein D9M68_754930 [compost metagenome]
MQVGQFLAEALALLPVTGRTVPTVLRVDLPALPARHVERQGHAGHPPAQGEGFQQFGGDLGQQRGTGQADPFRRLPGVEQCLAALVAGFLVTDQVADIHRLEQPAIAGGSEPATGVQGAAVVADEVQVEAIPRPLLRRP